MIGSLGNLTSYKPSNYVFGLIFVANIKFPRAIYLTIVPSTEELYCLIVTSGNGNSCGNRNSNGNVNDSGKGNSNGNGNDNGLDGEDGSGNDDGN